MNNPNILISIIIAIIIFLIIKELKDYRLVKLFKKIKTALNMQYVSGNNTTLKGNYENIPVDIFYKTKIFKRIKKKYIISSVKHKLDLSDPITIIHESIASSILKFAGYKDRITNNKNFDTKYYVKSDNPLYVTALLNTDIINLIDNIMQRKSILEITDNKIIFTDKLKNRTHAKIVIGYAKKLAIICKKFNEITNIKNRLAYNIENEASLTVRQQNLNYLILKYKDEPDIQELFEKLLKDREVSIQIDASLNLADKKSGMWHLYIIFKNKKNISHEDQIKIIEGFGANKYKKSAPLLEKKYLTTEKYDIKTIILKAMRALGNKQLNPFLSEQLDLCEKSDSDLRIQIIKALGSCGDKACIEKLYRLSKNTFNPFIKTALNSAISRIQSRPGKVKAGWISEAEIPEEKGALSQLYDNKDGAISKVKKNKETTP